MKVEEFKEKIAPYMKHGWVAMDSWGGWNWFSEKPFKGSTEWIKSKTFSLSLTLMYHFDIENIENWEKSRFEVGV